MVEMNLDDTFASSISDALEYLDYRIIRLVSQKKPPIWESKISYWFLMVIGINISKTFQSRPSRLIEPPSTSLAYFCSNHVEALHTKSGPCVVCERC